MDPIDDADRFVRFEMFFTGGAGSTKPIVSTACWVRDTDVAGRILSTQAANILAAWVAADADDDLHERENRPVESVITSIRASRPLQDPEPAPVVLAADVPGDIAGATWLPAEVSMVASLRTAFAGPAGRGRMYFPHLTTQCLTSGGDFSSTARTRLNLTISDFITELGALDYALVCVSRFQSPGGVTAPRVPPIWAGVVTNSVDSKPDSQRRRGA